MSDNLALDACLLLLLGLRNVRQLGIFTGRPTPLGTVAASSPTRLQTHQLSSWDMTHSQSSPADLPLCSLA